MGDQSCRANCPAGSAAVELKPKLISLGGAEGERQSKAGSTRLRLSHIPIPIALYKSTRVGITMTWTA